DVAGGVDPPDPRISGVSDQDVARAIQDRPRRAIQTGRARRATVTGEPRPAGGAGNCVNKAVGCDLSNALVRLVGDVHVAGGVDGHAGRRLQGGAGRRPAITEAAGPTARDRSDDAGRRRNLSNPALRGALGDIDVARAIDVNAKRVPQLCRGCRAAVTRPGTRATTGDRGDRAGWRDLPDAIVPVVRDEDVSRRIDRQPSRPVEVSLSRGTAIAAECSYASAGEGADDSGGRHHTNLVIVRVGDVEVAAGIDGNTGWPTCRGVEL